MRGCACRRLRLEDNGALAQLGERLLCKHQVIGSIPIGSTISWRTGCAVSSFQGEDHQIRGSKPRSGEPEGLPSLTL